MNSNFPTDRRMIEFIGTLVSNLLKSKSNVILELCHRTDNAVPKAVLRISYHEPNAKLIIIDQEVQEIYSVTSAINLAEWVSEDMINFNKKEMNND